MINVIRSGILHTYSQITHLSLFLTLVVVVVVVVDPLFMFQQLLLSTSMGKANLNFSYHQVRHLQMKFIILPKDLFTYTPHS